MHVRMAFLVPVDELDAELESAVRVLQELVFVDAQHAIELRDRRDRRLADTDDADLGGFDERDGQSWAEHARKRRSGHPSCRAAACNEYRSDCFAHVCSVVT